MPANWYWPVIIVLLLLAGMIWGWGGIQYSEDSDRGQAEDLAQGQGERNPGKRGRAAGAGSTGRKRPVAGRGGGPGVTGTGRESP